MPQRTIIHVDMDAFYASIEQRDRPELRGRPVVVGGSPRSRGVVCAASYEARRFGVRSAMACAKAWRLCPEAVFVEPDFARYQAVSRRIQGIFADFTPLVEPLSLDEAYLEVTGHPLAGPDIAAAIRARIRAETGLTASAGIAPNKFLAKVASDRCKPDGLLAIAAADAVAFIAGLPVGVIPGIGPVTARRCADLGIERVGDLLRADPLALERRLGSAAVWFSACARGEDDRPVCPDQERRSVGIEETFASDLSEPRQIDLRLGELAEGLQGRLRAAGVRARTITLKVTWHDFRRITRRRTLGVAIDAAATIHRVAGELAAGTDLGRVPARLLGLSGSHLDATGAVQETLAFTATAVPAGSEPSS